MEKLRVKYFIIFILAILAGIILFSMDSKAALSIKVLYFAGSFAVCVAFELVEEILVILKELNNSDNQFM